MKTFKWKLNFDFLEEAQRPTDYKKWFESVLIGTSTSRFKDGVNLKSQRTLFNIMNKIDASITEFIELEDSEFEFLKDVFENGKFNPAGFRISVQIQDAIDEAAKK